MAKKTKKKVLIVGQGYPPYSYAGSFALSGWKPLLRKGLNFRPALLHEVNALVVCDLAISLPLVEKFKQLGTLLPPIPVVWIGYTNPELNNVTYMWVSDISNWYDVTRKVEELLATQKPS